MLTAWPSVPLSELLISVSRREAVEPERTYRVLGAHWYAEGLYTKDVRAGAQIQAKDVYRVEQDDFVYNRLFAWKGAFAVATAANHDCYVSNEFPCFKVRTDRLDVQYLWRYFSRAPAWNEALGLSTGGTPTSRNRLKEDKLLAMTIPLPPLAEQRRIVARIEALAAKIEEARGLRREAAVEADALLNAARRHLIGEIPCEGWVPLGRYVKKIENGWSPACENRPAASGEWGVLKVGAVSFGTFDPDENKALPSTLAPLLQYQVNVGDFLMVRANTPDLVGACAIVADTRPKLMISDKIFRFIFDSSIYVHPKYLDHVLKSPGLRDQIARRANGTSPTMKNISKEKVLALLIPDHDFGEQQRIVAHLEDLNMIVDRLKRLQADTSSKLGGLLPALLAKAFKGELTCLLL